MQEGATIRICPDLKEPRNEGVLEESIQRGWLNSFGVGQWAYSGEWARLFRALQRAFVHRVQSRHGFVEWAFPRILPLELVSHLGLTTYRPGMLFEVVMHADREQSIGFLDPVQNVAMYELFRGKKMHRPELPLKIVECLGGWTWRNEDPAELEGAIRTREFLRVECAFLGERRHVRDLRAAVEQEMVAFLQDLQLPWKVVVGVGCLETPAMKVLRQQSEHADDVPVHDIEVYLGGDRWLEVAGCSIESEEILCDFQITSDSEAVLGSGCCGIGLNRLVHCLFSHHGLDSEDWPQELHDALR